MVAQRGNPGACRGSVGTAIPLRCACGRRRAYDSRLRAALGSVLCNNCWLWIRYPYFGVGASNQATSKHMSSPFAQYQLTPARRQIVNELNKAEASALRAALLLLEADGEAARADAHSARNIAQSASARRELIEQRWAHEDAERTAAALTLPPPLP